MHPKVAVDQLVNTSFSLPCKGLTVKTFLNCIAAFLHMCFVCVSVLKTTMIPSSFIPSLHEILIPSTVKEVILTV
jgi:hypothetical protein